MSLEANPQKDQTQTVQASSTKPNIIFCVNDIPKDLELGNEIAFDTEAMGLRIRRDRLCLLQLRDEKEQTVVIRFERGASNAPNIKKIFEDEKRVKIAHFARFDVRILLEYLNVHTKNIFCTHIASSMARTYTNNHSLKDVCKDMLGVMMAKHSTFSDWGSTELTEDQMEYAVGDVSYLHGIRLKLIEMLKREGRYELYQELTNCILTRTKLDIMGFDNVDLLSHHRDSNRSS